MEFRKGRQRVGMKFATKFCFSFPPKLAVSAFDPKRTLAEIIDRDVSELALFRRLAVKVFVCESRDERINCNQRRQAKPDADIEKRDRTDRN